MTATAGQENLNPGAYNSMQIKNAIDEMGNAWHELQKELPKVIEKSVDVVTKSKIDAINEKLTELELVKKEAEDNIVLIKRMSLIKAEANTNPLLAEQRKNLVADFFRKTKKDGNGQYESMESHQKALSMGSDPDGGILVRPYLDNAILQLLQEQTPFRQVSGQISISSDTYRQVASIDNESYSWTDDETSPTDDDPNTYVNIEIMTGNLRVTIPVPENLINDAFFDLETSIMQQAARKMMKAESVGFISGNGVKKPRGILTYPNGTTWNTVEQIPSGSSSALTYEGLMNLVYSLLSFYTANAKFMMNRTTINEVRLITYGSAFPVPIWQPSLIPGQPSTISGFPVIYAPDMPVFASAAKAIAFGDFSQGYLIVDRVGMTVLRDPFTRYPNILFRFLKRVGGGLRDYRAIKIQTIST